MRMRGVEPPLPKGNRHLKPARLPIPPHPQVLSARPFDKLGAAFVQISASFNTNINSFLHFVKDFSPAERK
jgi:hypothetical protein